MMFNEITVNDLQPTKGKARDAESADVKIRKAWSLQMPDEIKALFSQYPGQVRLQLYKSFDKEVNKIWTDMLAKANKKAADNGAQKVSTNGYTHLEIQYCQDPDIVLIEAAQIFIENFAKEHTNN